MSARLPRGGRTLKLNHPDEGSQLTAQPRDSRRARRAGDGERGQAMVEFALILFPLLLIVAGIIQFGIGLNYWLDMQRIANQGARWAAVNNWPPDCPRLSAPGTCGNWPSVKTKTLQQYIINAAVADGLKKSVSVKVCYPSSGVDDPGYPVRVRLTQPFDLLPILGVGSIDLKADATMRLEQDPTLITGAVSC